MARGCSGKSCSAGNVPPRAFFKTRIDAASRSAVGVLTVESGDLLLRASCSDDTFVNGPSLQGLSVGLEKPGSFSFDYDLSSNAPKFQFFSSAKIMGSKTFNLCYTHHQKDPASTNVETALTIDGHNKVACSYDFSSQSGGIKYAYSRDDGTILEPAFHLGSKTWDFAVSRKVTKDDSFKGIYKGMEKSVGLEWIRASRDGSGPFKISADVPIGDASKPPKLMMEKTWSY